MPYVFELKDFTPPGRTDGVKWVSAHVFEAAAVSSYPDGGTDIQTLALADYPDPANPPSFDVTVTQAQLASGWYWLVFHDAAGGLAPTTPEGGSGAAILLPPNASEVRRRSQYLTENFPPGTTTAGERNEELLKEAVLDSIPLIQALTGRDLTASTGSGALDRLGMRAITLKTERILSNEGGGDDRGAILSGERQGLKSISAGPWSETYFGPGEAQNAKVLDLDPALHEVLWALATQEMKDYWLYIWGLAPAAPFSGVLSFDWGNRGGSIGQFDLQPRLGMEGAHRGWWRDVL
jgi:hypothetical protein